MLEAYAEWYKGFTSGEIDSGSSPLAALAMAQRTGSSWSLCATGTEALLPSRQAGGPRLGEALVYTLAYDASSSTISLERTC